MPKPPVLNVCEHSFGLWLSGVEAPSWHKVLRDIEGPHIALSFLSLRDRRPKHKPYILEDRFDQRFEILVDSGGFGVNRKEEFDHEEHVHLYTDWVWENLDRISLVTEYDPVAQGLEWVRWWRERFWDKKVPKEKFIPIWHEEYGLAELDYLCENYPRVGVVRPESKNIEARLRNLAGSSRVKLHGVGISSPDLLQRIPFASVNSATWLSPTMRGEFHCWASNKLHWYPKSEADKARRSHRTDVERAGFDPDLVEVGDRAELNRYSAWAWRQFEAWLAKRRHEGPVWSAPPPPLDWEDVAPDQGTTGATVDLAAPVVINTREIVPTPNLPALRSERKDLPGLVFADQEVAKDQDGEPETVSIAKIDPFIKRRCDSCHIGIDCPEFRRGSECAFSLPVNLRSTEQLKGWSLYLLEMQAQRIAMLRFAEEVQGGAPDMALSSELDRYHKQAQAVKELFEDGFTIKFEAKGSGPGGVGVMSQFFGSLAGNTNKTANTAIAEDDADDIIRRLINADSRESEPEE